MTRVVLGPIFAFPVYSAPAPRYVPPDPRAYTAYRVTNTFYGPDLVNGGTHKATDLGNFRMNDPLKTPLRCKVRGRRHFDSTLIVDMDLGGGVVISIAHMNRIDIPMNVWTEVPAATRIGLTGNTGPRISDGKGGTMPMPAHTHIAATRSGVPFDIEPHLLGAPLTLEEDDVKISGKFLRHISNRRAHITSNGNFRAGVVAGGDSVLALMPAETSFFPVVVVEGLAYGTAPDRAEWYGAWNWVAGLGYAFGYYHSSLLPRTADGKGVALPRIEAADCSVQDGKLRRARTAIAGAAQAIEAAEGAVA